MYRNFSALVLAIYGTELKKKIGYFSVQINNKGIFRVNNCVSKFGVVVIGD